MEWQLGRSSPVLVTTFNAGVVTVTPAGVEVLLTASFSAVPGEVFLIQCSAFGTKGATLGDISLQGNPIFGATGSWTYKGALDGLVTNAPANLSQSIHWTIFLKNVTAGSTSMRIFGQSIGSNFTINANNVVINVLRHVAA